MKSTTNRNIPATRLTHNHVLRAFGLSRLYLSLLECRQPTASAGSQIPLVTCVPWCLHLYVGKSIHLSINRPASESFRVEYIHLPRTLANQLFLKLEGRQAHNGRDQKKSQLHKILGRSVASKVTGISPTLR